MKQAIKCCHSPTCCCAPQVSWLKEVTYIITDLQERNASSNLPFEEKSRMSSTHKPYEGNIILNLLTSYKLAVKQLTESWPPKPTATHLVENYCKVLEGVCKGATCSITFSFHIDIFQVFIYLIWLVAIFQLSSKKLLILPAKEDEAQVQFTKSCMQAHWKVKEKEKIWDSNREKCSIEVCEAKTI